MSIRVIAYTYEADEHCVECAKKRFADGKLPPKETDENSIAFEAKDSEGNPVHAILNIDETPADLPKSAGGRSLVCGTCHTLIKLHTYKAWKVGRETQTN